MPKKVTTNPIAIRNGATDEEDLAFVENAAMKLAKQRIADGTASSQLITHFLKLASPREKLEQERIKSEIALNKQKIKAIEQEAELAAKYDAAIRAMQGYRGARQDVIETEFQESEE